MFGCCLGTFACLLVTLVLAGVLGWFFVLPPLIESNIHSSTISFDYIEMSNATMGKNGTASVHMLVKSTLGGKMHAQAKAGVIDMSYDGQHVGSMDSPDLTIKKGGYQNTIDSDLNIHSVAAFDKFSLDLLNKQNVTLSIKSDVKVQFPLGSFKLTLPGTYKLEKNVTIAGVNNQTAQILSTDVSEKDGKVVMSLVALLPNPSIVSIVDLGDLTLDIQYKGSHIATAVAEDIDLEVGNTTLHITAPLLPGDINSNPEALEMLGNYISNLTTDMTAKIVKNSHPLYNSFLAGYSMPTTLQPLAKPILRATIMNMTDYNVGQLTFENHTLVATRFGMANPLSIPIHITTIDTDVTFLWNNSGDVSIVPLGNVTNSSFADGTPLDVVIPPKGYILSKPIYVHVHNISRAVIAAMSEDLPTFLCLGAHGHVESKMGNLDTTTKYLQGQSILTCSTDGAPDICTAYLNGTKPSPCN